MKPLQAICFDLDATLVHLTPTGYSQVLTAVHNALVAKQPELDIEVLDRVNVKLRCRWRAWEQSIPEGASGLAAMRTAWADCLAESGFNLAGLGDYAFDLYWELSHTEPFALQPFDEVVEVLESLHGRYRLAVITNGPRDTQVDKLAVCGLEAYFDAIVASGDVGSPKPNAAIFKHTLRLLGVSADEALHVGDHLIADVGGAMGTGMCGVWLNRDGMARRPDDLQPNHEIASLAELTSVIEAA